MGTGVCGTDLHLVTGEYPHGRFPVIPGHEFAGYITEVGTGVTGFAEGDYVGVNPNITCGECTWCQRGATNLCTSIEPVGVSINGSNAELVTVPIKTVFKLDRSISHQAGPLIEPFACVLHGLERVPDWKGQDAVVFGAGSIGLMSLILAKSEGASDIRVVELNPTRRQAALDLGASAAVASVEELGVDGGVDLTIDATGHPAAIAQAIKILGPRGRLIQMGVAAPSAVVELSPYEVFAKEISIVGSQSLAEKYEEAAARMVDLQSQLTSMVTATFPLEEYAQAIAATTGPDYIKVQVLP